MRWPKLRYVVLLTCLVSTFATAGTQSDTNSTTTARNRVLAEIESAIVRSQKIGEGIWYVRAQARAAGVLWAHDRARARSMFLALWKWIGEQEAKKLDRELARSFVIRALLPKDRALANRWMNDSNSAGPKPEQSLKTQLGGSDPAVRRLSTLATDLIDEDPIEAAGLLQRSLTVSVSPAAYFALTRLREKDPILADYVASQTIDGLVDRPTLIGLVGIHLLLDYVFPAAHTGGKRLSNPPDFALQNRFFFGAHAILTRALAEQDKTLTQEGGYTEADLRLRSIYQARLAAILAAISPQFSPELTADLNATASRLAPNQPANADQISRFTIARLTGEKSGLGKDPQSAVALALSRGDFDEAKKAIEGITDEKIKKPHRELISQVEFRTSLSKGKLTESILAARAIEDVIVRANMFLQVSRAARAKGEVELSNLVLAEARAILIKADCSGLQILGLLSLSAQAHRETADTGNDVLWAAISCMASLSRSATENSSRSAAAWSPRSLLESSELKDAFSSYAASDFEGAVRAADAIEDPAISIIAKLDACEASLKSLLKSSVDRSAPTDSRSTRRP